jgi:cytochrome o ubiquinol oxidase subunit 2
MDHRFTTEAKARRRVFVIALLALAAVATAIISYFALRGSVEVFSSAGPVASQERGLILFAMALSLVVIIPVFSLTFFIAWKYRATNTKARYNPEWDHNRVAETIWWLIPTLMIFVIAIVAWQSSHALEPSKALASNHKTLKVQVVAMQWRWLFIYPEQGVASMNALPMPVDTPVQFDITADAPMNSFWIPKLGGQIYAMTGMSTHLNLMATHPGDYRGVSANISGSGFSDMHFIAHATDKAEFDTWVKQAKHAEPLSVDSYANLARPSKDNGVHTYRLADAGLYDTVVMKYMHDMNNGGTH